MRYDTWGWGAVALCALDALAGCSTCGLPAGACEETADCPQGFWCNPQQQLCMIITDSGALDAPVPDRAAADVRRDSGAVDRPAVEPAITDAGAPDRRPDMGALDRTAIDSAATDSNVGPDAAGDASHIDATVLLDSTVRDVPVIADSGCVVSQIATTAGPQRLLVYGNDLFVAAGGLHRYRFSDGFGSPTTSHTSHPQNTSAFRDIAVTETDQICAADGSRIACFEYPTSSFGSATEHLVGASCVESRQGILYFGLTTSPGFSFLPLGSAATNAINLNAVPRFYISDIAVVSGTLAHAVGRSYASDNVRYHLYEVANASLPARSGDGLSLGGECTRVAIANDRIYAACGDTGLFCNRVHQPPAEDSCGVLSGTYIDVVAGTSAVYAVGRDKLSRIPPDRLVANTFGLPPGTAHAVVAMHNDGYAAVGLWSSESATAPGSVVVIDLGCAFGN